MCCLSVRAAGTSPPLSTTPILPPCLCLRAPPQTTQPNHQIKAKRAQMATAARRAAGNGKGGMDESLRRELAELSEQ